LAGFLAGGEPQPRQAKAGQGRPRQATVHRLYARRNPEMCSDILARTAREERAMLLQRGHCLASQPSSCEALVYAHAKRAVVRATTKHH
jgi:hypothetical protein